jgi:hypothetical protein
MKESSDDNISQMGCVLVFENTMRNEAKALGLMEEF